MRRLPVVLVLALAVPAARAATPDEALADVRPEAIRAHMEYLADDLLEGRGTGSRGYDLASAYVAAQYALNGLEPAGSEGWFQPFRLRRATARDDLASFVLDGPDGGIALEHGVDYLIGSEATHAESEVRDARVVFVGWGVRAPEYGYDDYAGVDVRGALVIVMRGAPATFPGDERAFYASSSQRDRFAAEAGAVGILHVRLPEQMTDDRWQKALQHRGESSMGWIEPTDGSVHGVEPRLRVGATLSRGTLDRLLGDRSYEDLVAELQEGRPVSFDTGYRATIHQVTDHGVAESRNVVARIPGSDPLLRDECVVYTAHLDHIGIGQAVEGDSIYNGAYDNASGSAVLLEAARVMATLEPAPRRSVIFLAVTGEEKGLLGSEYFCAHPPEGLGTMVANVNLDMVLMNGPIETVIAFGAEHSSLEAPVQRVADAFGVTLVPDPVPEEVLFIRSDQYPFVKAGIPAVFFVVGPPLGRTGNPWGSWIETHYHSRQDDMNQEFHWDAGVTFTRMNVLLGMELANADERPTWKAGDFFGKRFGGTE